jgi:hypothetical protein
MTNFTTNFNSNAYLMNASGGIWLAALSSVKTKAARSKTQPFSSKHLHIIKTTTKKGVITNCV